MNSGNRKSEQAKELLRAMGGIDDRFLMEAIKAEGSPETEETLRTEKSPETTGSVRTGVPQESEASEKTVASQKGNGRRSLRRYSTWALTAAACLTVVVIGRYVSVNQVQESTDSMRPSVMQESVTELSGDRGDAAYDASVKDSDQSKRATAGEEIEDAEGVTAEAAGEAGEEAGNAMEAAHGDAEAAVDAATDNMAADNAAANTMAEAAEEDQAVQAPMGAALTVANPFIDAKTLEEAEAAAGFSITLPEVKDYDSVVYRAMEGEMLEVIFFDKENSELYRIRKGKNMGSDISGVYYTDGAVKSLQADGREITLTGEEKDKWNCVVWTGETDDGTQYSYSIFSEKEPLTESEAARMAEEMMSDEGASE